MRVSISPALCFCIHTYSERIHSYSRAFGTYSPVFTCIHLKLQRHLFLFSYSRAFGMYLCVSIGNCAEWSFVIGRVLGGWQCVYSYPEALCECTHSGCAGVLPFVSLVFTCIQNVFTCNHLNSAQHSFLTVCVHLYPEALREGAHEFFRSLLVYSRIFRTYSPVFT